MLSEVSIEVRSGENWVCWSYPPTIMAALRDPARWARLDLNVLARLSTYAAVALYEICARYRDNPSGVTSRKPASWWADALSQTPAGSERREWRKFKNEKIRQAVDEINNETDLEIAVVEHKQGRAVAEVQFSVRRKRGGPRSRSAAADIVDANLVLRAESLGVRESKLDELIKEFGEARVREKVEVLERRAANNNLRGVENSYSYLRSLLRNADDVAASDRPPLDSAVPPTPSLSASALTKTRTDDTSGPTSMSRISANTSASSFAVPIGASTWLLSVDGIRTRRTNGARSVAASVFAAGSTRRFSRFTSADNSDSNLVSRASSGIALSGVGSPG